MLFRGYDAIVVPSAEALPPTELAKMATLAENVLGAPFGVVTLESRGFYAGVFGNRQTAKGNDNVCVAMGFVSVANTPPPELKALVVRRDVQRQGLGSQVLRLLEEEAAAKNITALRLTPRDDTVDFYKAHGYEITQWWSNGTVQEMSKVLLPDSA